MTLARTIGRATLAVVATTAAVLTLSGSAQVDTTPLVALGATGAPVAQVELDDARDRFCLEVRRSGAGAVAVVRIASDDESAPRRTFYAFGDDDGGSCHEHHPGLEGTGFSWSLEWTGADGRVQVEEGRGTY